ncbi:sigma-70 family RNA polymerase sigma factor [Streptomyces violascens]|uniref:hypothetical protein n=1 Tax=Streptomyces violascens TaxID=67381 RepID=UPI0036D069BE
MTQLTHAQISAAKTNDIDAVAAIIRETEDLVCARARRLGSTQGHLDTDLMEDLAQVGRIAVWESIATFTGAEPAQFMAHLDQALTRAMADERREATRPGVGPHTAKVFEAALRLAGGDPYEAERLAVTGVREKDRLSRDLARAARLSWMGIDSLDGPYDVSRLGEGVTLGDVIAQELDLPADLVDSRDIMTHRRTVIRNQVHRALGALSERQRHVLKAGFGVHPVAEYRPGVDDDELAGDMGATRYQVQQARTKGAKRFSELYQAGAQAW